MNRPTDVPYADAEPLAVMRQECLDVESECASHGVDLHPAHHEPELAQAGPVAIDTTTEQLVDGMSAYGA